MILSLDISTSVIGMSLFGEDHKLHELSYLKLNAKEKSLFNKLDQFEKYMEKYSNIKITDIAIEAPLLKFAGKFSNALTIQKLTQMNSLISGFLYKKYGIEPHYYNVQSARSLVFPGIKFQKQEKSAKYIVWEAFVKLYPTINWEYSKRTHKLIDETFDSVDAAVIGLAHIVTKINSKSTEESKSEDNTAKIS